MINDSKHLSVLIQSGSFQVCGLIIIVTKLARHLHDWFPARKSCFAFCRFNFRSIGHRAKAQLRRGNSMASAFFLQHWISVGEISARAPARPRASQPPLPAACARFYQKSYVRLPFYSRTTTVIALNDHLMDERRGSPCMIVLTQCKLTRGVQCCVYVPMEEVRISDWPEPPGSHAWLPAYGYQHDLMDKDDYFGTNGECRSFSLDLQCI